MYLNEYEELKFAQILFSVYFFSDCNVVGHPEEVIDEIQETKPKKIIG